MLPSRTPLNLAPFAALLALLIAPAASSADATILDSGDREICAVRSDHRPVCWGIWEIRGGTDDVTAATSARRTPAPKLVRGTGKVRAVSTDGYTRCYITLSRRLRCHGFNEYGQLANRRRAPSIAPVTIRGVRAATDLSVGGANVCAVHQQGRVSCWGEIGDGEPGAGEVHNNTQPRRITRLPRARTVARMESAGCALLRTRRVSCWGSQSQGIGRSARPRPVPGLGKALQVTGEGDVACAVRRNRRVACWGNWQGKAHRRPITVPGLSQARRATVQARRVCVTVTGAQVRCHDLNTGRSFSPLPAASGLVALAATNSAVCGAKRDRSLICENSTQVTGPTNASPFPTPLTGVADLELG
ncbi:MAG: RCC1 domain-containing protein, partial [Solirubrobacteraceae bacterium]